MTDLVPGVDFRTLYDRFDTPLMEGDCGKLCAPHNPHGVPFCCDICHAVPAVYHQEWEFLRQRTDLWHVWRGDECAGVKEDPAELLAEAPEYMLLLACRGVQYCQREYRSVSCRQFPFFPYVTEDYRFLGLAYHWEFEPTCWVISNLGVVTKAYRTDFIRTYDELFALWQEEFESYAGLSEMAREYFSGQKRRIPILHRNGGDYLLSPGRERLERVPPGRLPKFGPYR
jgi:hypothetical protein